MLLQIVIKVGKKSYDVWGVRSWSVTVDGKGIMIYTLDNGCFIVYKGKVISSFLSYLPFSANDDEVMKILR